MNKNQNSNERKPRQSKFKVIPYKKGFESFEEMITSVKELHPEFETMLDIQQNQEQKLPVDQFNITQAMIAYFINNAPDVTYRKNLPVNISASSNRVSLKTTKYFTFEFSFRYDRDNNISNIEAIITVFLRDNNNSDEITALSDKLAAEWEEVKDTRPNRKN